MGQMLLMKIFKKLLPKVLCYLGRWAEETIFPMAAEHLKSFLPTCIAKSNATHTPRKEDTIG